jgi:hypothetical protein
MLTATVLDAPSIMATLEKLHARIVSRFPEANLGRLCSELVGVARVTAANVARLSRPFFGLRLLAGAVILAWLGATGWVLSTIDWADVGRRTDVASLAQGLDSLVNLFLLAAAALWFVITLERRIKRSRTLGALYELRSIAHVIDMHQLTKDPTMVLADAAPTSVSPERHMSEFELARYLDYCAEMLALTAKLAALYAGATKDDQIMSGVNEVENLASNLGRKIWQKIMILSQLDESRAGARPARP